MNRRHLTGGCALLAFALLNSIFASKASAQAAPFFNAGATSFTPEISIVSTGVVNDVQATVSADRKYVTLTMRPQSSTLLNLRQFTFQTGAGGTVGGAAPLPAAGVAPAPLAAHVAAGVANALPNILNRPGMTRVAG